MALLDLALQQEQGALQGQENASQYSADQLIQDRIRREQARNAPIQLVTTLAGHASDYKSIQDQKAQDRQTEIKGDIERESQQDPRDAEALKKSQEQDAQRAAQANAQDQSSDSSSGLFGWLGKNLIGGFFGGSGGGGSAAAGAAAAASGGGE